MGNVKSLGKSKKTNKQDYSTEIKQESEELSKKNIIGTPMDVVRAGDIHFIALKNYRVSDNYNSEEEAIEKGMELNWNNIVKVICVAIDIIDNEKKKIADI